VAIVGRERIYQACDQLALSARQRDQIVKVKRFTYQLLVRAKLLQRPHLRRWWLTCELIVVAPLLSATTSASVQRKNGCDAPNVEI
jgi:hypothetical protein